MKIVATIQKPSFNARGYVTQFFKDLRQQTLLAAADFLAAAAPAVPIDTGMARGSFLNLQALLEANGIQVDVPIPRLPARTLKNGRPLTYKHSDGSEFDKTPRNGAALSTSRGQIIKRVGSQLKFTYQTTVYHYNINDESRGWESFRNGQQAFLNRMQQFKFPQVSKYIVKTTVTYGADFKPDEPIRVRAQRTVK